MLKGIAVVWMPVQDIERAKGFCRDTLGLPITKKDGDWAPSPWAPEGSRPFSPRMRPLASTSGPVVTFQPEASLEETVNDLQSQGVEVPAGISEHPWGRVATFKYSEGNDVQLYEPPSS